MSYGRAVVPENLLDGSVVPSAELSEAQDVTQGLGDPIKYGYHDAVLRQFIEYRRHSSDLLQWFIEGVLLEKLEWDDEAAFSRVLPGRSQLDRRSRMGGASGADQLLQADSSAADYRFEQARLWL